MSRDTPSNRHAPTLGSPGIDGRIARFATAATEAEAFLWTVVGATVLLDVGLTAYGLDLGLTEGNPIAAAFVERFGVVVALGGLKAVALGVALAGWALVSRPFRGLVPLGLALPWTAVTFVNAVTILTYVL
ncbi:MAG: DUF5658 family protein [Halobacterium sp.]